MTVFNSGNAGQAVRASASIPNVFLPVEIRGKQYVDGGLSAPVPVSAAKRLGANVVIAVDISARPARLDESSGFFCLLGPKPEHYEHFGAATRAEPGQRGD